MRLLRTMLAGFRGFPALLSGQERWRQMVDVSGHGLQAVLLAYGIYLGLYLLAVPLTGPGLTPISAVVITLVNLLPPLGVALVTLATVRFLVPGMAVRDMLVPALYALTIVALVSLLLLPWREALGGFQLALFAVCFYRVARATGRFGIGVSIAYALANVVLLVGAPLALYMLLAPGPGPI